MLRLFLRQETRGDRKSRGRLEHEGAVKRTKISNATNANSAICRQQSRGWRWSAVSTAFCKITELPTWLQIFLRDRTHFTTLLHVILSITFSIMKMIQHGTGINAKRSSKPPQARGRTSPSLFRWLSDLHFKALATWTPRSPCTRTAPWQYFYF